MNSEETGAMVQRYLGYTRELSGRGVKPVPPVWFCISKDSRDHSPEVYREVIIPGFQKMKPPPRRGSRASAPACMCSGIPKSIFPWASPPPSRTHGTRRSWKAISRFRIEPFPALRRSKAKKGTSEEGTMREVHFIDTTLRDGNQSLWALNMRTGAMLAIAGQMDQAGFESMEFFVTAMFKKYVREHKENPWDWLRLGTKRFSKTQLRWHGGLHGSFEKIPDSVYHIMVERAVSYGFTLTRTSNSWNDYTEFKEEIDGLKKIGMETIANLIYSVSPRHTDEYYAEKAREAAAIRPYGICFKDVGGLLTPERARTLIPIIQKNVGDVPLEFHGHCNSGQAPL